MRRNNIISAVGIAALLLGCSDQPAPTEGGVAPLELSASAGPVIEMVTGSGHFIPDIGASAGAWRTFSMTARKYADGSVKGHYVRTVHREGVADKGKGVITCFTRVGNKVWIGGYEPALAEPNDVGFQAVDNGEGAGDPPDQMGLNIVASDWGYEAGFAQDFCDDMPDALDFGPPFGVLPLSVILYDVEAGNVQIQVN